jgi:hypothetical protein
MLIVLKSEVLILLEPSGPVQGCNGINVLLPLYLRSDSVGGCAAHFFLIHFMTVVV